VLAKSNGLCNGRRLICCSFQKNVIEVEIATRNHQGKRVFLPRILLTSSNDIRFPFTLKIKQFLIRLAFALTINKSQGQTIPYVGIYLPEHVFSHGQLYVTFSKSKSQQNIKLLIKNSNIPNTNGIWTCNVVYKEVLEL